MKIFIICSKAFYKDVPDIKSVLEGKGHEVFLPNCYDDPGTEQRMKELGKMEHAKFKAQMLAKSEEIIKNMDAVLVLNFTKNNVAGYIGGATFIEMYDAFRYGKKIFMYNDIPEGLLKDEINGFNPLVIQGDIDRIS